MTVITNCQVCAVQQGTHKPAEALSVIAEPAQQPDAFQIATALEESFTYASTQLAADMLRAQHARIAEMEVQLATEATRTAEQKLRAEQMSQQHDTQAALNREAREQLAALK